MPGISVASDAAFEVMSTASATSAEDVGRVDRGIARPAGVYQCNGGARPGRGVAQKTNGIIARAQHSFAAFSLSAGTEAFMALTSATNEVMSKRGGLPVIGTRPDHIERSVEPELVAHGHHHST